MLSLTIFSIIIFTLVLVLLIFTIKVYTKTKKNIEEGLKKCNEINGLLKSEIFKNKQISQKIDLADGLQTTLFKRFFKITEDLLLVQKLIFDNYLY